MPWWGWLALTWLIIATVAVFWLGAIAAMSRRRERAARAHQYREAAEQQGRVPGPPPDDVTGPGPSAAEPGTVDPASVPSPRPRRRARGHA
jgi:hypothetical protein